MENTIHYKFVKENFTKTIQETILSADAVFNDFDSDLDDLVSLVETCKTEKIINLTTNELKEAMSNDEEVFIDRTTIIVSEDIIKNTVSLKLYKFKKVFVRVSTSKKRKFKILLKKTWSLTINKSTGEFSVYAGYKKRKYTHMFVRKNLSNSNIRYRLRELQRADGFVDEMSQAIKIFYGLLGYNDLGLTYTDTIRYFYNTDPNDHIDNFGLPIFPFLNYLRVNSINIISYHALYYFEWIFNHNKARYKGADILHYMMDYYGINDRFLLTMILFKMIAKNEAITTKPHDKNDIFDLTSPEFSLYFIDYTKLKLFHDLNISQSEQFNGDWEFYLNEFLSTSCKTSNDEKYQYKQIYECIKLYGFTHSDIFINPMLKEIIKYLMIFKAFGVKLKINNINQYMNNEYTFNKIFNLMFESANMTGTYKVDKKSLDRIKLYFKGYKIDFQSMFKFKKQHRGIFSKQDEFNYNAGSFSFLFNVMKNPDERYYISINPISINSNTFDPNLIGVNHPGNHFTSVFNSNKNGLASSFKVKVLYSKNYFEKLCHSNNINVDMWVDYLKFND
jgi:hypothetical protein